MEGVEFAEAKRRDENERMGEGRVERKRASGGRWTLFSGERGRRKGRGASPL